MRGLHLGFEWDRGVGVLSGRGPNSRKAPFAEKQTPILVRGGIQARVGHHLDNSVWTLLGVLRVYVEDALCSQTLYLQDHVNV